MDNRTSAPVGAPATPRSGWARSQGHPPGAKTRRGSEKDCAVWHREYEECTASTPAAAGWPRPECNAEPRVIARRWRRSVNAGALYFSCYLQCGSLDCTLRVRPQPSCVLVADVLHAACGRGSGWGMGTDLFARARRGASRSLVPAERESARAGTQGRHHALSPECG
jgi:hypothetical protein